MDSPSPGTNDSDLYSNFDSDNDDGYGFDDASDGGDEPTVCHFPSAASHLAAECYCFLCQRDLPHWPGLDNQRLKSYGWEFDLVGLQELPSSLRAARLAHRGSRFTDPSHARLDVDDAELCFLPRCPGRGVDRPVHVAHLDCWSAARRAHGSLRSLFRLARTTRHIIPLRCSTRPESPVWPLDHSYGDTSLGRLLRGMALRLPTEVYSEILGQAAGFQHESGRLVRSLIRTCSAVLPCASDGFTPAAQSWEKVACQGLLNRLNIETGRIHGLDYITKVRLGGPGGGLSIPLRDAGVRGIRFALDTYGLRAIRVLYDDDSASLWLGSPEFSWFGEVHGNDMAQISVLADSCRIIRIGFGPATIEHPSPLSRGLWSQECALDSSLNRTAVNYTPREPWSPAFYQGWTLRPYIAFGSGAGYISGLTAYLRLEDRLVAYSAHGRRYQRTGPCYGEPMHLPLQHGERIVAVWVSTKYSYWRWKSGVVHYLLVTTSLGRSHVFGPDGVFGPALCDDWTCLVPPGALAAGIFFADSDAMVGATWRPDLDTPDVRPRSLEATEPILRASVSTASLADVRVIEVVRGERHLVAGVLVTHSDGGVEVLGCYDPQAARPTDTIYEASSDGPLLGVIFVPEPDGHYSGIRDVKAVTESSPGPDGYFGFGTDCTVGWWNDRDLGEEVRELQDWEAVFVHETSPLPKMTIGPDVTEW